MCVLCVTPLARNEYNAGGCCTSDPFETFCVCQMCDTRCECICKDVTTARDGQMRFAHRWLLLLPDYSRRPVRIALENRVCTPISVTVCVYSQHLLLSCGVDLRGYRTKTQNALTCVWRESAESLSIYTKAHNCVRAFSGLRTVCVCVSVCV